MVNALELLNAAKKQKTQNQAQSAGISPKSPIRENYQPSSIEDLQSQYFGDDTDELSEGLDYTLYPNGEKRPVYDPYEEMKSLKNGGGIANNGSKMPSAILESIMNNPLDMPTEGMIDDDAVLNEELQNKTKDIINKLESRDRKGKSTVSSNNTQQQYQPRQMQTLNENSGLYQNSSLNNNELASLIENIIDKKLKQYAGAIINESKKYSSNSPSLNFMRIGENFTFMDDANNVYECKLVYKGKGKVKSK